MSSSRPLDRLQDIIDNCDNVFKYTKGLDERSYETAPQMVRDAVEPCLQRISEAAYKLGDSIDERHPNVDWLGFRGIGNILRHGYDILDNKIIWATVSVELPALKASAIKERDFIKRKSAQKDNQGPER
ncbi:HepT-like ribonuclease domain-containing protein [Phreatobacter oligotrophus]|uniref:HepT-like ribonuclease domain-containing protein n=1 Tax=Phreatobacter oligotrophus TaxID=1122261 RepID=UPI000D33769F|nr:HepT-like ribonuclease domain-containing protein [Phreatobacter oligotrophus]